MKTNNLLIATLAASSSFAFYASATLTPIEPPMVTIPAGSFEMGSMARESSQPVHKVNIKQFSMGKYEVTVSEFRQFVEATNYPVPQECRHELDAWFRPSSQGNWETNALNTSEYQPVVCINWRAANAYAQWLTKETGKPYRLPTEAEWEYAAKAGTKTDYFFGDDTDMTKVCDYANVGELSGENILQRDGNTSYYNWSGELANCVDHAGYASIVGMYKPNQFGLYDVLSNVLEYLADCYVESYQNTPLDGSAHLTEDCKSRATRGGAWHWSHWPHARRGSIPEDFSGGVDGFRLALDGKAPKQSKATKRFSADLAFAQKNESKRRLRQPEFPAAVSNVKLTQDDESVTLTWDASKQDGIEGYRVYRNQVSGGMFTLLATNLKQTIFVDSNLEPLKYDYTVVAVKRNVQGNYSTPVSTKAGWSNIPGKVQAQWAVDYTDSSLSRTSDTDGGFNLTGAGGIAATSILTYQVEVANAGLYTLEYRVAAPLDTKGFEVFSNDKSLGSNLVGKTGGYHEWQTQQGKSVMLKKGRNILTIKSLDKNWKLNWLALTAD
jgi:formylglycine-generating enzyme required for sulfatase activity